MLLLIGELADKGKENKYKYYADRFKDKKKARIMLDAKTFLRYFQ